MVSLSNKVHQTLSSFSMLAATGDRPVVTHSLTVTGEADGGHNTSIDLVSSRFII